MSLFIHALSPLVLFLTTGCGSDTQPKGKPPIEKSSASEAFTDVRVLVNGVDATNGIVTVPKGAKMVPVTVTMKVDKTFGPLEFVGAETKKFEDNTWRITTRSEFKQPEVMPDGKLKATLYLQLLKRPGDNHLRITTLSEKHEGPVYITEGIIRVVEGE